METMSARGAKDAFRLMIDSARAEPALFEKYGRGIVVVVSVEEYDGLSLRAGSTRKRKQSAAEASKQGQ